MPDLCDIDPTSNTYGSGKVINLIIPEAGITTATPFKVRAITMTPFETDIQITNDSILAANNFTAAYLSAKKSESFLAPTNADTNNFMKLTSQQSVKALSDANQLPYMELETTGNAAMPSSQRTLHHDARSDQAHGHLSCGVQRGERVVWQWLELGIGRFALPQSDGRELRGGRIGRSVLYVPEMERDQGHRRLRMLGRDMRRRARPHPGLELKDTCHLFGKYDPFKNTIIFGCRNDSEGDAVGTLIHEETHWATFMFLDGEELTELWKGMPDCYQDFKKFTNWIPEGLALSVEKAVIENMTKG